MAKKLTRKPKKAKSKPRTAAKAKPARVIPTTNGRLINNLMIARSAKGDYRDYVLFTGSTIIDWLGSWDAFTMDGVPVGVEGVALVHKSRLHSVVGEKWASKFWNKTLRRRVSPTQQERANAE